MIRRLLLGLCEARDPYYQVMRCKLRHRHDGRHYFGWLRTLYLTLDLDAPVPKPVASPPTQPATPMPGASFRCGICGLERMWRIDRWGDAVVSWACADHLSEECERLQRDGEVTKLSVRMSAKLVAP